VNDSRREFLKDTVKAILMAGLPLSAFEVFKPEVFAGTILKGNKGKQWAFVVDITKCVGCGMCVKACKLENEVPYDTTVSRTWVERYVVLKDGKVLTDSPMAGRDGYLKDDPQGQKIPKEDIARGFFVPKLCNLCRKSTCVQVCPVGASHYTPEGIVLVDREWCIGCGYCIMACPYGTRFFHPVYKTAEKCNICYHRITKGMNPACVDACTFGVRKHGDINDPNSEVRKIVLTERVGVLKDEYGTMPTTFYIGLDHTVR